jgi:peptidoglycan/xylan/chitin deacetylase (PgdA/CDA1 family)
MTTHGAAGVESIQSDSTPIPILVYHNVAPLRPNANRIQRAYDVRPEVFEAQMSWLRAHNVGIVSLGFLVDVLDGKAEAPKTPTVVITLDDGWEGQYRYALPVLRRFGYPATFFVFTNPIGRRDAYLTWEQLGAMRDAGMTIGSHSRTHPDLARLHDSTRLHDEVEGSRRILQQALKTPIEFFAYPFGEYSVDLMTAVQRAGYRAARSYSGREMPCPVSRWCLRAVGVPDELAAFERLIRQLVVPRGLAKFVGHLSQPIQDREDALRHDHRTEH